MARRILYDGVVREFQVYLPPDWMEIPAIATGDPLSPFRNALPLPVVVVFHGGNSSVDDFSPIAKFDAISRTASTAGGAAPKAPVMDEDKFITVYVQGLGLGPGGLPEFATDNAAGGGSWNDGGPTGHLGEESSVHRADDVGLVHSILELLDLELTTAYRSAHELDGEESLNVLDRRRIFITGFSGGAGLVYRLAADPSPHFPVGPSFRFAAMAPVAGTAGGFRHHGDRNNPLLKTNWDPALAEPGVSPLHIIAIHGTQDRQVGSQYQKVEEQVADPSRYINELLAEDRVLAGYLIADEMTLGWSNDPAGSPPPEPPDGDASYDNARLYKNRRFYDEDLELLLTGLGYDPDRAKELARWDLYLDASLNLWTRFMGMTDIVPDRVEPPPDLSDSRFVNTGSDSSFVYSDPPAGAVPLYGGKVVRVILVDGEEHAWPRPGFGEREDLNIDATRVIWSFFKEVSFL